MLSIVDRWQPFTPMAINAERRFIVGHKNNCDTLPL
jgi:hypothetical protein